MTWPADIRERICKRLATGESLRSICRTDGFPNEATVRLWEREGGEFATQSARAREIGCHSLADECLEIADNARNDWMKAHGQDDEGYRVNGENVQRSRLRIDTRVRLLGKWLPKVYGDRLELAGEVALKKTPADFTDAELAEIAAKHTTRSVSVPENGRSDPV